MTEPRRRWFRFAFSLRTLFVVVTAVALLILVAPDASTTWRRRVALRTIRQNNATVYERAAIPRWNDFAMSDDPARPKPSRLRIWLGDEQINAIDLPPTTAQAELEHVKRLFPEAQVSVSVAQRGGGFF